MPVKSRLLVILTLSLTLLTLTATYCDEWDDAEYPTLEADLIGFNFCYLNNTGKLPFEITDGRCPANAFILALTPQCHLRTEDNINTSNEYVYYGDTILTSNISDLRIITTTHFNDKFPSGSNVTDLFKRYPIQFDSIRIINDVPPFYHWIPGTMICKALLTSPDKGTHSFLIEIELDDGRVLSQETAPITFY